MSEQREVYIEEGCVKNEMQLYVKRYNSVESVKKAIIQDEVKEKVTLRRVCASSFFLKLPSECVNPSLRPSDGQEFSLCPTTLKAFFLQPWVRSCELASRAAILGEFRCWNY